MSMIDVFTFFFSNLQTSKWAHDDWTFFKGLGEMLILKWLETLMALTVYQMKSGKTHFSPFVFITFQT